MTFRLFSLTCYWNLVFFLVFLIIWNFLVLQNLVYLQKLKIYTKTSILQFFLQPVWQVRCFFGVCFNSLYKVSYFAIWFFLVYRGAQHSAYTVRSDMAFRGKGPLTHYCNLEAGGLASLPTGGCFGSKPTKVAGLTKSKLCQNPWKNCQFSPNRKNSLIFF